VDHIKLVTTVYLNNENEKINPIDALKKCQVTIFEVFINFCK